MRRLYLLRARSLIAASEAQRLLLLTLVIGAVCGLAAVAFHLSIRLLEGELIDRATELPGSAWIVWTILTPTLGGLACGALLQYAFPRARGSGIPEVKVSFANRGPGLRIRDSLGKFATGALQIGSGSSLGREGPTVHICAGIAHYLGRIARISPRSQRRLLPVGAAAGIAAAFNAPMAAVTFAIEEIVGDLDKAMLTGVIVAAALAAVIERGVLGTQPIFELTRAYGLEHASSLLVYALLGVAAGIVSVTFTQALLVIRRTFRSLRRLPAWARPGVGGLVTGVLAVLALHWYATGGLTGGGYSTLARALDGAFPARVLLVLASMKLVATAFSYGSGGAGGLFAPALFIGGMLGGAFGSIDATLLGHVDAASGSFALVGMGAVFAGALRAPITSVLIILEMTGGYGLILPLMIANMAAYALARRISPVPIYDALLEQDGVRMRTTTGLGVLESVHLERVLALDSSMARFDDSTSAKELLDRRTSQEVYPVVDRASQRVIGLITDEELDLIAAEPSLHRLLNAVDLMRPPVVVRNRDDLRTALETMLNHGIRCLPVVDDDLRLAGMIDEATIARAYMRGNTT